MEEIEQELELGIATEQIGAVLSKEEKDTQTVEDTSRKREQEQSDLIDLLEKEKQMLHREVASAIKGKENAVMKFASLEISLLGANKVKDSFDKKIKDLTKENEILVQKNKALMVEKTRICNMVDEKVQEVERIKTDFNGLETKSKWNTIKLKQEMQLKVVAEQNVEKLIQEVNQLKLAEISREKEELEVERNMLAEKQLLQQNATLILLKHDIEEKDKKLDVLDKKCVALQTELDAIGGNSQKTLQERNDLHHENGKLALELNETQILLDKNTLKIAELQSNLSDLETCRAQLTQEKESTRRLTVLNETLQLNFDEQSQEIAIYREKETELLQLNKELSENVVQLNNSKTMDQKKTTAMTLENDAIKKEKQYYDETIKELKSQLAEEQTKKTEERMLMVKHLSEKTKQNDLLQKKLDNAVGDLDDIKKKHLQALKETNRELLQLRKKCQQLEESEESPQKSSSTCNDEPSSDSEKSLQSSQNDIPSMQTLEPSKKSLIDRIVRLQHANARQTEKMDFLENHSANLTAELQKKSKILSYYIVNDQTGALTSSKSDKHKLELAKYGGGIMAAIYGGKKINPNATDMTLDLSLEINKKLQAVCEDTLLKNITLKENLNTLGMQVDQLMRKKDQK